MLFRFNMGKFLLMLLLAWPAIHAPAQVIKGSVVDSKTGEPVSFASVYFNGTTVGTISNENGEFELDISRHSSMPLIVSAVGYSTLTLDEFSSYESLNVSLLPLVYDIDAVTISARSLKRERRSNLRIFREQFLGRTIYARRCEILNEQDLTFNYGFDNDTLVASALNPLQVRNEALGYMITFYLEDFAYCRKTGNALYTGTCTFMDDGIGEWSLIEGRRMNVYLGSAMHFFRSLWADDLKSQGFSVLDHLGKSITYDDIVIIDGGQKYLVHQEGFRINYDGHGWGTRSFLSILKSPFFFDESGYFDPVAIMLIGEMGKQRVGDMLPLEFVLQ
jgi:hypothetical protein